jgi:hypothetical protein
MQYPQRKLQRPMQDIIALILMTSPLVMHSDSSILSPKMKLDSLKMSMTVAWRG